MNDPKRLLAGEAEPHELRLLRAAVDDGPSADALAQLKQALGLHGFSAHEPPTPSVARPPAGSSTAPHAPLAVSSSKWLLIAGGSTLVVGALITLGTLGWTQTQTPAAEPTVPATLAPPASTAREALPAPSATNHALPPSASAQPASAESLSSAASAGLADELQRLEGARTALRRSSPKAALAALDDYDRQHPRGALREEAMALRIEGSLALGARAEARQLAATFLRDYPGSVHGARLRAQLAPRADAD